MSNNKTHHHKKTKVFKNGFRKTDSIITDWMSCNSCSILSIAVGIIFFWFGFLKFFPGLSPAEGLVIKTIRILSYGILPDFVIMKGLALWEVVIGIGLISRKFIKATLILLFLHMLGTFTPIFLFTNEIFTHFPYALTFEGQYIIKNLVLIAAGIVIGSNFHAKSKLL